MVNFEPVESLYTSYYKRIAYMNHESNMCTAPKSHLLRMRDREGAALEFQKLARRLSLCCWPKHRAHWPLQQFCNILWPGSHQLLHVGVDRVQTRAQSAQVVCGPALLTHQRRPGSLLGDAPLRLVSDLTAPRPQSSHQKEHKKVPNLSSSPSLWLLLLPPELHLPS